MAETIAFEVGDFVSLNEFLQIAELSGRDVALACGRLGMYAPFRNPEENDNLSFQDMQESKAAAIDNSRVTQLAENIGEEFPGIGRVVFSKTGAIAIKGTNSDALHDAFRMLEELDKGNVHVVCTTHTVVIG